MGVRIHILNISRELRDQALLCRGAAIEQERADMALEAEWRRRVAENVRARRAKQPPTTEGVSLEHRPRAA